MIVNLTDNNNVYPLANASQGVGACLSFSLTPADIFTPAPLVKAKVTLVVGAGAETGDFTMEGKVFAVDNGSDYTSSTFKVVSGDVEATARNIRNMLLSNKVIIDNWDVVLTGAGLTKDTVECTPRVWSYNPSAAVDNFDNGYIVLTNTAYNNAKVVEGLKVVWQLFEGNGSQVMAMNGIVPIIDQKTGDIKPIHVSFNDVVTRSLKTTFPFWKYDQLQYDYTIWNRYFLRYGWLQVTGCGTSDMLQSQGSDVLIVNTRLPKNSTMGFIPYCYDTNYPTRRAKFLNVQAERGIVPTSSDSYHWLWYYDILGAQIDPATIRQFIAFTFYDALGNIVSTSEVDYPDVGFYPNTPDSIGVLIIPCGFGNCPVAVPSSTVSIRVSVRYEQGGIKTTVTDSVTFRAVEKCSNVEFYYLCTLGGYDTIHFDRIEEVNFTINQANIETNKVCRDYKILTGDGNEPAEANIKDYLTFLNTSGRKQTNTDEVKEYRVTSRRMKADSDDAKMFEEFLKSESRKIRLPRGGYAQDTDYAYAENIILVHSSIITDREEGTVQYQFVFQYANKNGAVSEY